MELTLNLVWVCVAIAGILAQVAVLSRASASSDGHASARQKAVAMCCALVILFFVISMTDDLHGQAILFEEKKPSRLFSETVNTAPASTSYVFPFVFIMLVSHASITVDLPAVRRSVNFAQVLISLRVPCGPVEGRAPPVSFA